MFFQYSTNRSDISLHASAPSTLMPTEPVWHFMLNEVVAAWRLHQSLWLWEATTQHAKGEWTRGPYGTGLCSLGLPWRWMNLNYQKWVTVNIFITPQWSLKWGLVHVSGKGTEWYRTAGRKRIESAHVNRILDPTTGLPLWWSLYIMCKEFEKLPK